MENFTVLKKQEKNNSSFFNKNKKPLSFKKIFLLINLFLLILIVAIAGLIYSKKLIPSPKKKAATRYAFGCIGNGINVNNYLSRDGNCAAVLDGKKTNFGFGEYFFCANIKNPGAGCPNVNYPADESYMFKPPSYGECFKKNCGTEQIDFKFSDAQCFFSRVDEPCDSSPPSQPTSTPIPTNTPTPTAGISPTITNTPTPTPTTPPNEPTYTPAPTATLIPVLCGTKDCDDRTNPCRSGYVCIQANDGSNYCASPDFVDACRANPSYNSCCTAPGAPTATPTEIVVVKTTSTPQAPVSGEVKRPLLMFGIPLVIIISALLL